MKTLYKFMQGRYGIDELYKFLFWFYIIIFICNIFLKSSVIVYFEFILIIYMFFRVFSKNKRKRYLENERYLKIKRKILTPFKRYKDRKNFVYKRCSCKTVLRLPLPFERGIKKVKCPECQKVMKFLCLRKQKIEIIKN